MPRARHRPGYQITLQLLTYSNGTFAAHADEPHAAARKPLDRRHSDILG